ncbi:MAG: nickel-responsive transcriptional regulator NikR [Rikenellaceae bacterium]|jgi:CopG family nickel-responsive transcriptional regulator|nr:nickel-responsive transcriptional regulator NikR [Rikenellaceae bacterium]
MAVSRFGISLESDLLEALDAYVAENNFPNRSQAVRQLVERNIVEHKWQCSNVVAGAIILIYDRRRRGLVAQIADVENAGREVVLSTQRFDLSESVCFEIVAVRGMSHALTKLSDRLISVKGVLHGKLIMTRSE